MYTDFILSSRIAFWFSGTFLSQNCIDCFWLGQLPTVKMRDLGELEQILTY